MPASMHRQQPCFSCPAALDCLWCLVQGFTGTMYMKMTSTMYAHSPLQKICPCHSTLHATGRGGKGLLGEAAPWEVSAISAAC